MMNHAKFARRNPRCSSARRRAKSAAVGAELGPGAGVELTRKIYLDPVQGRQGKEALGSACPPLGTTRPSRLSTFPPTLHSHTRNPTRIMDNRNLVKLILAVGAVTSLLLEAHAAPLGTAFTYQGRLADGSTPANGLYDLRFTLFDAATAGSAVGIPSVVTTNATPVSNGVFSVSLDFGSAGAPGAGVAVELRRRKLASPRRLAWLCRDCSLVRQASLRCWLCCLRDDALTVARFRAS